MSKINYKALKSNDSSLNNWCLKLKKKMIVTPKHSSILKKCQNTCTGVIEIDLAETGKRTLLVETRLARQVMNKCISTRIFFLF